MRIVRVTALVLSIVVLSYGSTANAELVNGGFETGDLAGWTTEGMVWATDSEVSRDFLTPPLPQAPASGFWGPAGGSSYFASLWSTDSAGTDRSTMSQRFETDGDGLVLEFDYFYDFGDVKPLHDPARIWVADNFFDVFFEMTINDPNPLVGPVTELGDDVNIDWTTVSVVLPTAGWYTVGFEINDSVGLFESYLGVDNVSVVPLPGALVLGALGLGSAGGLLRRLRRGSRS